ncbi:hypothetical protein [Inhella gelatinilytica]|uniref:Uncharacterized protein n=1 Tax=Inhella gelatinilytica TaxID=2795030 RepID=A0A931NEW6_9BURK|nr:hypothetical protein [Inhella gelatinilytica]MBH9552936.1 hypothetical protein [Inhella gelatinilytica]
MELSTFQDQVRRSEAAYRAQPDHFSRETALWAALPHAVMGAGLAGGAILLGWGFSGLISGASDVLSLLFAIGAALAGTVTLLAALVPLGVRLPKPEGLVLAREAAPGLFEGLDRLQQFFLSEPLNEVHLSTEFEVRLVQRRRWGLLGSRRHTLLIGLPLLMALERRRLLALVGLAVCRLRRRPERFTARMVLQRELVQRVAEQLAHDRRWIAQPTRHFYAWLAPRFLARTQPLVRYEVLMADRLVAKRVGPDIWEAALKEAALKKAWMDQAFWPWLWLRAQRHETPKGPHRALKRKLIEPLPPVFARQTLAALWRRDETEADPQPSLRTRLQSLDPHAQRSLPAHSQSAASKLIEEASLQRAIEAFDREWGQQNAQRWQAYRGTLLRWREQQSHWSHAAQSADELTEWTRLTLGLDPKADVRGPLMAALAQRPQHAAALKGLAEALEALDRPQSLALTTRLFEISPTDKGWAAARMVDALENPVRDVDALRHWRNLQATVQAEHLRIDTQLQDGEPLTHSGPPDLSKLEQDRLLLTLRRQPAIERAWLARKVLPEFLWLRAYVLVLDLPGLDRLRAQALCDELSQDDTLLPGPCRILPVQVGFNPLQDPLQPLDLLSP